MANALALTLHASAPETASGVGEVIDIGKTRSCAQLDLSLDDLSGTGASLSVALETCSIATGRFRSVGVLGAASSKLIGGLDRYVRANWTIGGTPPVSVTFALTGEAHTLYATPGDIQRLSLTVKALSGISDDVLLAACLAASDEADGYLGGGYTLPLVAWSTDLRRHVADIGAMTIMKGRGFQPGGVDELIVKGQDDAVSWLTKIARRLLDPPGIIDSTPTVYEGGASVVSDPPRGNSGYW